MKLFTLTNGNFYQVALSKTLHELLIKIKTNAV